MGGGADAAARGWAPHASKLALGARNPIREIVDKLREAKPPEGKPLISLSQGDPTAFPGLGPPPQARAALADAVRDGLGDGYAESSGTAAARDAVARSFGAIPGDEPLRPDETIITVGCSQALQMALTALTDGGRSAVLLPRPCFPLYATLADFVGAETVYYDLLPERGWEADLPKLRETIASLGDRAACLMVNNPGNPTGSVYSKAHLRELCALCEDARVPIVADEVYAGMAFDGRDAYTPIAAVRGGCPVISVGALSKLWLAPGWRLGWLNVHDSPERVLREHEVVLALQRMAQITIGTAHPVQAALPRIIAETPEEFFADTCETLRARAALCAARVEAMPSRALRVTTQPQGAMYLFVRVDADFLAKAGIADDTAFCQRLLAEEGVVLLPGAAFAAPGFARIVVCAPDEKLNEAFDRIDAFCTKLAR